MIGRCVAIILVAECALSLNPLALLEGLSSSQPRNEQFSNVVYTTSTSTTPRSGRVTYVTSTTPRNEQVTLVSSSAPTYYTTSPKSQRVIYDSVLSSAPRSENVRLYSSTVAPRRYAGSLYSTSARQVQVPRVEVVSSTSATPFNINPRATIQVPYVSQRQEVQAHIPSAPENTVETVEEIVETQPEAVEVQKKVDIITPVVKKTTYEVRKPAIEKQFFDIEEKVEVRPAGTVVVELDEGGSKVKKDETITEVGKPTPTSDCDDAYVSTPGPVVAYNGESGLSTASGPDYDDNVVDYNESGSLRLPPDNGNLYFGKQTKYVPVVYNQNEVKSSRLTAPEEIYNDLLSNKNSVSLGESPTAPGERVISATPAPLDVKPASQTSQTRRIVVNHPFETVQLEEKIEPQEKVQAVTITQRVEPARYRASSQFKATSRLIQAPTVVPVRVVEAPRQTVVPLRIVEAPKPTVLPVRIVEAPKPTVLPVRIVEAPKPTVLPVRIVEAPKQTVVPIRIVEAKPTAVPVRIVETSKTTVLPIRVVEAPTKTVVPVTVVEAPKTVVPVQTVYRQPVQYVGRYASSVPSLYSSAALTSGLYGGYRSSALTSGYYPSAALTSYGSGYSSGLYGGYSAPYTSGLYSSYTSAPYTSYTSGYTSSPYTSGLYGGYSSALTSGYGGYDDYSYGGYSGTSAALTSDYYGDGYYK